MAIVWKRNGRTVDGPECIPEARTRGLASVRASYKRPIELQSMGFLADPSDVAEHRRRFPTVELVNREGSMVPVMHSLGEKRKYLKESGWVDTRSF
jgi:hypothetical protein